MTKEQKEIIIKLRDEGLGYGSIAKVMNMPKTTIASFLQRHGNKQICLCCGKEFDVSKSKHKRKFCSSKCCKRYWNKYGVKHTTETKVCPTCGATFTTYRHNIFCSHECYLKSVRKGNR